MDIFDYSVISSDYIALNKRVMYRGNYSDYARFWGLDPGSGKVFYCRTSRLSLGPTCTVGTGVIFPRVKRPGPYVYSSPSGDEVKNESSYTSVSPIRLHDLMRNNFSCLIFSAIELEELQSKKVKFTLKPAMRSQTGAGEYKYINTLSITSALDGVGS
jgi:hypothetical protein